MATDNSVVVDEAVTVDVVETEVNIVDEVAVDHAEAEVVVVDDGQRSPKSPPELPKSRDVLFLLHSVHVLQHHWRTGALILICMSMAG